MSANLRELMDRAAAEPSRPVDSSRVWRRGRRRLWARRAASAAATVSLLAAGWTVSDDLLWARDDVRPAGTNPLDVPGGNIAAGRDAVWVYDGEVLHRLEPETGAAAHTVQHASYRRVMAITAGGEAVWAYGGNDAIGGRAHLYRLDLEGPSVVPPIATGREIGDTTLTKLGRADDRPAGPAVYSAAYGYGSLWVADPAYDYLLRVDGEDSGSTARVPIGGPARRVVVHDGSVWALRGGASPALVEVDPARNAVTGAPVSTGVSPCTDHLAAGERALWLLDSCTGQLLRVEPAAHVVVESADLGRRTGALTTGLGAVWVVVAAATPGHHDYVIRVDAETMERTVVDVPASVEIDDGIEVAHGALWVAGSSRVTRVDLEP